MKTMTHVSDRLARDETERLAWVDAARALGIVLVVYGHAARSMVEHLPLAGAFKAADAALYTFHMPLFFLLAGMVTPRGIEAGRLRFLRMKLISVVYPYALWSLIYGGIKVAAGPSVNKPIGADALLRIAWEPIDHLWFLYALFACQIVALLLWPSRMLLVLAVAAAVLASPDWLIVGLRPALFHFPIFVAGMALSRWRPNISHRAVAALGVLAAIAFVGTFALAYPLDELATPVDRVLAYALAAFGILVIFSIAPICGRVPIVNMVGRASLAIYVMHTIFSAGIRIALPWMTVERPVTMLMIMTLVGVALPFVAYLLAERYGLLRLLGLGSPASTTALLKKAVERAASPRLHLGGED